MKCKHVHKDAPDNSICEDCFNLGYRFALRFVAEHIMKGGQDGRKRI